MTARTEPPPTHKLPLDESDRQLVLLALAVLSLESPGFEMALHAIALRIDNAGTDGRAELFDAFRDTRRDVTPPRTSTKGILR